MKRQHTHAEVTADVPADVWEHVIEEHNGGEVPDDPEDVGKWIAEYVFLDLTWNVPELPSDWERERERERELSP